MHSRHVAKSAAVLAVTAILLFGCDWYPIRSKNNELSDMQDRQQELTRQDYRDMNKAKKLVPDDAQVDVDLGAPPIPDIAQVLAAPRPPKIANAKLVTLSVTDDVPLRDVLFELGRLANVDIEVGNGLDNQGINLRATDRPFNEVIERIADLGGLRYSVRGNAIRVERDLPYIKNYTLDFVNIVRSSQSNYTLNTSVLSTGSSSSGGGGSGGGGGGTGGGGSGGSGGGTGSTGGRVGTSGSSSSIDATSESDLWAALESSISEILNYFPQGSVTTGSSGAPLANDMSTPAAGANQLVPTATTGGASTPAPGFVINRQAGILSANATERQHEMIDRFLTLLARNASAQVLIEAKIVEVSLTDQFQAGVDWNKVIGNLDGIGLNPGTYLPGGAVNSNFNFAGNGAVTFGVDKADLSLLVNLTERFGTTRTLSSPRLSAINNQQAVLTFAQNVVFFDCTVEAPTTTNSPTGGTSTTTSTAGSADCTPNSVPIGIILNILPSINVDKQEITLSVRPTLTRQVRQEENPEGRLIGAIVAQAGGNATDVPTTFVPVIEVREIDSVMKVKSGGVMVIGGLMEDISNTENRGIPGMSDLPIIGSAFKSRDEQYQKRELIIFIKATIVNTDGSAGRVDKSVIDRFTTDPRPLFVPKQHDAQ